MLVQCSVADTPIIQGIYVHGFVLGFVIISHDISAPLRVDYDSANDCILHAVQFHAVADIDRQANCHSLAPLLYPLPVRASPRRTFRRPLVHKAVPAYVEIGLVLRLIRASLAIFHNLGESCLDFRPPLRPPRLKQSSLRHPLASLHAVAIPLRLSSVYHSICTKTRALFHHGETLC